MAAILLDVDGVLHLSCVAVPGAAEAVARLRADGHRLRFVTNNTTRALSRAFHEIRAGAHFACLHRNRWWQTGRGPLLDSGAFVAGLEYTTGVQAEIVGKPSRAFFEAALGALGARPEEATMIGDDVEADVGGAKALGLRGILVRTGKFREDTLARADPKPDAVLDSIADLPAFLESTAR